MADDIDRARERESMDRERAIAAACARQALPYTGACHNCDAALEPPLHFCDSDCRDDYQKREKAGRR